MLGSYDLAQAKVYHRGTSYLWRKGLHVVPCRPGRQPRPPGLAGPAASHRGDWDAAAAVGPAEGPISLTADRARPANPPYISAGTLMKHKFVHDPPSPLLPILPPTHSFAPPSFPPTLLHPSSFSSPVCTINPSSIRDRLPPSTCHLPLAPGPPKAGGLPAMLSVRATLPRWPWRVPVAGPVAG